MRNMRFLFIPGFMMLCLIAFGEKPNVAIKVSAIPPEIRDGADAVLRYSETTQQVLTERKVKYHYRYAITILNEAGERHSYFVEFYDKKSRVKNISGVVYDAHGYKLEKLSGSDIEDYSAVSSGTLYQDDRMKVYAPEQNKYPYTVVYEYDKEYDGMVYYPAWKPQPVYRFGVEKASYTLVAAEGQNPRYKCENIGEPEISDDNGKKIYTWKLSNLKPLQKEPLSVPFQERVPVVYLAPGKFSFNKTEGDLSTWKGLGEWISGLNEGRQDLPEETIAKVKEITAGLTTKKEKAEAIYRYMQDNTRYVNVSLGIGGFQPYPASFVAEKGYGDCKALSNYTLALLDVAGIEAHYALVNAGSNAEDIITDFPSNQFNHVILCVPNDPDTIWLECTSQEQPFNFLGTFTSDRDVLLVKDNKGVLVHTPVYKGEENIQYRRAEVALDNTGNATATIFTRYGGLQYENAEDALMLKGEDLKKRYYNVLDIPDLVLKRIQLDEVLDNGLPEIHETIELELKSYMAKGGKRLFLPMNLMNKTSHIPKQLTERETDMMLTYAYCDSDTIVYTIPGNMEVEYAPSPVKLETEFGKYHSLVNIDGQRITYIRNVSMKKGRYPKEMFAEFAALRKKIVKADKCKVLLKYK